MYANNPDALGRVLISMIIKILDIVSIVENSSTRDMSAIPVVDGMARKSYFRQKVEREQSNFRKGKSLRAFIRF